MLLDDGLGEGQADAGPSVHVFGARVKGFVYKRLLDTLAVVGDLNEEVHAVFGDPRA